MEIFLYVGFLILIIVFILNILRVGIVVFSVNSKQKKEEKKFKQFRYVDTFFYKTSKDEKLHIYHIIKDLNTSKLYALNQNDFKNSKIKEQNLNQNCQILEIYKSTKHKPYSSLINEKDTGSFKIKKEITNFNFNNEEIVLESNKLKYGDSIKNCSKIDCNTLYNLNSQYNMLLLEEVTFIEGTAKFDVGYEVEHDDWVLLTNLGPRIIIIFLLFWLLKLKVITVVWILLGLIFLDILIFVIDLLIMKKKGYILAKAKIIQINEEHWRNMESDFTFSHTYPLVEYYDHKKEKHEYMFIHQCHLVKNAFIFYHKDNPKNVKEGIGNLAVEELINNLLSLLVMIIYVVVNIIIK